VGPKRPLAGCLATPLKSDLLPQRHCYYRRQTGSYRIQAAAFVNADSAESPSLLPVLGWKLLELTHEIADTIAIARTGYIWRLMDRVKIKSQAHCLALE
jgi:hypothetical protein